MNEPHHEDCTCDRCKRRRAKELFSPNPDRVTPEGMRRSIHRSHRGEGFNDGVGE